MTESYSKTLKLNGDLEREVAQLGTRLDDVEGQLNDKNRENREL